MGKSCHPRNPLIVGGQDMDVRIYRVRGEKKSGKRRAWGDSP